MTYLWMPALAIEMWLEEGVLLRFLWGDKIHQVQWVARHWRIDVEWWEIRIWRHYYKLITDTGLLVVVFYDLLERRWYLQQLYD